MKIPNFNTISTAIDRLTVEVVKRSHFEFLRDSQHQDTDVLNQKIELQSRIIEELKNELTTLLCEVFEKASYEFIQETRTFK